jgi:hypothetical protein
MAVAEIDELAHRAGFANGAGLSPGRCWIRPTSKPAGHAAALVRATPNLTVRMKRQSSAARTALSSGHAVEPTHLGFVTTHVAVTTQNRRSALGPTGGSLVKRLAQAERETVPVDKSRCTARLERGSGQDQEQLDPGPQPPQDAGLR